MDGFKSLRFTQLRQLSLQSNRLTKWTPELFAQVAPNLENVYLGSNRLPDLDLRTRESMNTDALVELDLSCNALTEVPQFPKPMLNLEELWLNDNLVDSVESLKTLGRVFPKLRTIYIERNPVHSQCPLDCRNIILQHAPRSLEQIDASRVNTQHAAVSNMVTTSAVKSILKH
jgi:protein phosphatase 1 regulatory subunit 7